MIKSIVALIIGVMAITPALGKNPEPKKIPAQKAPQEERILPTPGEYEPAESYVESLICSGGDAGFLVSVPLGWELDANAAQSLNVCALLRPAKATFDTAPSVIYPLIFVASNTGDIENSADKLIADTANRYRGQAGGANVSVTRGESLLTPKGPVAIRYLNNGPSPNEQEAVGYFAHKDTIFAVILSARSLANRDANDTAWRQALMGIRVMRIPSQGAIQQ